MELKAVCFDIDGTLYPKWQTKRSLLPSLCPSPTLALKYHRFRRDVRLYPSKGLKSENREEFLEKQAAWIGGKRAKEKIENQFYAKWRSSFKKIKPYPFVRETFEWLKAQGLKIAVLSDFPLEQKLHTLRLEDLVDYSLCSEETGYLKPHIKPFTVVCEALALEPTKLLYVGDSYTKDVVGASATGMYSALIKPKKWGKGPDATFTFSDYNEFKRKVENYFLKGES